MEIISQSVSFRQLKEKYFTLVYNFLNSQKLMKNLDVKLIEYGLAHGVFMPQTVLDLLYHPLEMTHSEGSHETYSEINWSVNNFTEIPFAARKKLVELCFISNAEETALALNRRFACTIYALLKMQKDVTKNANGCEAFFEEAAPNEVMQEIFLWHKCGLKMTNAKLYLLKRIFSNAFPCTDVMSQAEADKQRSLLRFQLTKNKRKTQRRTLKLALTQGFIHAYLEDDPNDIKELDALRKEEKKLKDCLEALQTEYSELELKMTAMEIFPILQENFPLTEER